MHGHGPVSRRPARRAVRAATTTAPPALQPAVTLEPAPRLANRPEARAATAVPRWEEAAPGRRPPGPRASPAKAPRRRPRSSRDAAHAAQRNGRRRHPAIAAARPLHGRRLPSSQASPQFPTAAESRRRTPRAESVDPLGLFTGLRSGRVVLRAQLWGRAAPRHVRCVKQCNNYLGRGCTLLPCLHHHTYTQNPTAASAVVTYYLEDRDERTGRPWRLQCGQAAPLGTPIATDAGSRSAP